MGWTEGQGGGGEGELAVRNVRCMHAIIQIAADRHGMHARSARRTLLNAESYAEMCTAAAAAAQMHLLATDTDIITAIRRLSVWWARHTIITL